MEQEARRWQRNGVRSNSPFPLQQLSKAILSLVTHYCSMVCLSTSPVTLVHPAKAAERNTMPFGMDTCVVPSNIALDRDLVLIGKRRFGGQNPQLADMTPIGKLLCSLFYFVTS